MNTHIYIHTRMHVCIQAGDRVVLVDDLIATGGTALAFIHIPTYIHIYIHIYIHRCNRCIHTYIHTYIHTGWRQSSFGR
jgi:hypothetical protein